MSAHPSEWAYVLPNGDELRVMRLPDRKALYLILIDGDGMHAVARTLGDREVTALVAWLDAATGPEGESERERERG